MRVVVALEHRFLQSPDGSVYPNSVYDGVFWSRYLDVFDEVAVFARISQIAEPPEGAVRTDGATVKFLPVPGFLGPWQYLKIRSKLVALAGQALGHSDACILRVPGQMGTLLWRQAAKAKRPYAVEVVGDPWDSLAPGGVRGIVRPIARLKARWELRHQCRGACAAGYVTKEKLQERYPTGAWSVHYSSIELPEAVIADEQAIKRRIDRMAARHGNDETWRICFVGTLAQLYKAPDVLINAVADCIGRGIKLELVILGEGRFQSELEGQVRILGIGEYVKFMGQAPAGQAVYEQLDQADLFVLPSLTEGLARSVIEAMARGLPCVTSNAGGLGELMEPRYMVAPGDVKALSDKIAYMVSNVDLMKEAALRNVKLAGEYCSGVLRKRRNEFYTKVREATESWSKGRRRHEAART